MNVRSTILLAVVALSICVFAMLRSSDESFTDQVQPHQISNRLLEVPDSELSEQGEGRVPENKKSPDKHLSEKQELSLGDAFNEENLGNLFNRFYKAFTSNELSLDEEAEFRQRFLASLAASDDAPQRVLEIFEVLQHESFEKRAMLINILDKSELGRAILIDEGQRVLSEGQQDRYWEAFQLLANYQSTPDSNVVSLALDTLISDVNEDNSIAALHFLAKPASVSSLSEHGRESAISDLENLAGQSSSNFVRGLALQQLYRLLPQEDAEEMAVRYLATVDNNPKYVNFTLDAISKGVLAPSNRVLQALDQALTRPSVTDEELELASEVFLRLK